jgi:hypothetical protein
VLHFLISLKIHLQYIKKLKTIQKKALLWLICVFPSFQALDYLNQLFNYLFFCLGFKSKSVLNILEIRLIFLIISVLS